MIALAFVVVSLCSCFLAAPQFYLWLVTRLGGPLTRATVLHIFANCCANFMVVLASWSARGRLDMKLGRVLSATFASLMINFLLVRGGAPAVAAFIAAAMLVMTVTIGGFGPRTRSLTLEEISR